MGALIALLIIAGIVIGVPLILIVIGFWLFIGLAATTPTAAPRADHSVLNESIKETP
jgi:hypothetical protein